MSVQGNSHNRQMQQCLYACSFIGLQPYLAFQLLPLPLVQIQPP